MVYALSPALSKARIPARAIHLLDFAAAVLAAYGLTALLAREAERWSRRVALAGAMVAALVLATATVLNMARADLDDRFWLTGFGAAAVAGLIWLYGAGRIGAAVCSAILIFVTLAELTNLTPRAFSHVTEGKQLKYAGALYRNRDIADFLRAQPGPIRVDVNDADFPENFGDWHAIDMLQGYVAGVPLNLMRHELHTKRTQELFAVTHVIGKTPDRPDQSELFTGATGLKVFRNPDPQPRAWSVHNAVRVAGDGELRIWVQDKSNDLARTVALLEDPPAIAACAVADNVRITRRGPDRVTIAADMGCRGMVILADSYFPGWRLTVDGQPSPMFEAYGALRGIVVERGAHTVDMIYRPRSILWGAALSGLGLMLTLGLVLVSRRSQA
ncbi:MAG: hypothetical protein JSR81_10935 [Proteobacteria bacterium]|nr:hypothetical protein [Pseudomonadota bacterium]